MSSFSRLITMATLVSPAVTSSSRAKWIAGRLPTGSSSLGTTKVTGRILAPCPAAGMTAFLTRIGSLIGTVYDTYRTVM